MSRKLTESVAMNEINIRLQQTSESHTIDTTCLCNIDNCHGNLIFCKLRKHQVAVYYPDLF